MKKITRHTFLFILLCLTTALSNCVNQASQSSMSILKNKQPNILFIFADDMSYQVVNSLGNAEVQTPQIDLLMNSGTIFSHTYNQGGWNGAICVASRSMLNCGQFLWNAHKRDKKKELESGQLWSQLMAKAGYDTYFSGKWHVSGVKATNIFKTVGNVRGGMPRQTDEGYNRPIEGKKDVWSPYDTKFGGFWEGGKHWSEVLGDNSVKFIQQAAKSDKPFFMYLAFNAPHDPRQSPKKYVDKYPLKNISIPKSFLPEYPYAEEIAGKKLRDERLAPYPRTHHAVKVNRQEYYAIITHMDDQIRRIIEALKASGKYDNTYIVFTADHGLSVGHHGLIGKQNMYDHSMRVPFVICGPGIKAQRCNTSIYLQDIMPTTLELAGIKKPEQVQFKSLIPLLENSNQPQYDAIYGGYIDKQRMITMGDFKLIHYPKSNTTLLFDLKNDPEEMKNLAADAKYADTLKSLKKKFIELQKETGDDLKVAF